MADILVTGSEGFIGRHLVRELVKERYDVCATYGYTPPEDMTRTRYLSHFHMDVTDFNECMKIINQEDPVVVYHLVAQPIVTTAITQPFPTMELTVRGSYNMLEALRQTGKRLKAIVYVSSDKVYGDNSNAIETDRLMGIDHPYNVAKVAGDVIAQMYAKTYGLPIVISRSANIYGGGDFHWDRLIPGVSRDIILGRHPIIRSNGKQVRDYIYVSDAVQAQMKMAWAMMNSQVPKGEIFNFGSMYPFDVQSVVDLLLETSGRGDLSPIVENRAKGEIDVQHMDFAKAKMVLEWMPTISMKEGLERTFSWYKQWFGC
ncbi:MAG TPA: NAD-dependent epimerase/dehydratase family protein [Candidatus Paceibacterota bacterium]